MASFVSVGGTRHRSRKIRSPKGVFPVAGMGPALKRERTIASAYSGVPVSEHAIEDDDDDDDEAAGTKNPYNPEDQKMGEALKKVLTKVRTRQRRERPVDIESAIETDSDYSSEATPTPLAPLPAHLHTQKRHTSTTLPSNNNNPSSEPVTGSSSTATRGNNIFRHLSFGGGGKNSEEISRRLSAAKITNKAAALSNDIAGIHTNTVNLKFHSEHRPSASLPSVIPFRSNRRRHRSTHKKSRSGSVPGSGSKDKSKRSSTPKNDDEKRRLNNTNAIDNSTAEAKTKEVEKVNDQDEDGDMGSIDSYYPADNTA
ncbi:unnamed protein product [Ambrosiozyma monospora]|uniref:Unnamed protein product n=1 Tax=Ambrosiozyma monospora TaxID=43982 RepID=A0ACB5U1N9_AMBMO|nr:unnamed protein product [Ambrosiozyma monospora]